MSCPVFLPLFPILRYTRPTPHGVFPKLSPLRWQKSLVEQEEPDEISIEGAKGGGIASLPATTSRGHSGSEGAAMAATAVTDSGGVRIITEVIPASDPRAAQLAAGSQPPAPAGTSFRVRGFRRAQPKVLGVRCGVPCGGTGHLGDKTGTEDCPA